jgi:hypothetical protein
MRAAVALRLVKCVVAVALVSSVGAHARAQEPPPTPPPAPPEEERSTGLPKEDAWTFNLDAGVGGFGFANSLYRDVRPDPSGDLGDNWFEGYVKPAVSVRFALGGSELYGKLSAVGERTHGAAPSLVGEDASSFKPEDLYVGWRSGKALGTSENLLEIEVGRAPYTIGHGLLLWDGGGEGGSRGGFWTNARKAWQFAAVGRVKPKNHTLEAFYVDRDEVPESETGSRVWGANYQLAVGERSTFGATYMKVHARRDILPGRDGLNVYSVRAFTAPFPGRPGLSFELEYAREHNGGAVDADGWTAQAAYELGHVGWKPRLSYRYARFEGDDPATPANEAFDPLFPGFSDWGTWWQGEIAGEYFLSNSNLVSHQVRLHLTPGEAVGAGLIAYVFRLDQPGSFAPRVTSRDLAFELDGYADWKINGNFTASFVAAYADPQDAVKQAFGRTKSFAYGMVYLAYAY